MTDEEKKAIENCNDLVKELKQNKDKDFIGRIYYKNVPIEQNIEILLNLIQKQQKELEKKDEMIDEMAEYMAEEFAEYQLDYIYQEVHNVRSGMERNWTRGIESEIKDIKQYFKKKVEGN